MWVVRGVDMRYNTETNHYELSSGKEFYAHIGILGLNHWQDMLYEGYDGEVEDTTDPNFFTPDERKEIAEFMCRRWRKWGET